MPISIDAAIAAALVFAGVALGMRPLIRVLERLHFLDHPNERSSHHRPTLVGGGILVVGTVLAAWLWLDWGGTWPLALLAAGLAAVSLLDDLRGMGTGVRLLCHVAAVTLTLYLQPGLAGWLPAAIPEPLAFVGVGIAWVWFINLFNFMDGIDGITGVETLTVAGGIALLAMTGAGPSALAAPALTVAAAAAGFLLWNWHPAKIFMGDVGSVPLGYLLGWMLLTLAASGAWPAALILPAYYLADATLTILRRLLRGAVVWKAHREHFYQRAVQSGLTHAQVSLRIAAGNMALVILALAAGTLGPGWALAGAVPATAGLLAVLSRAAPAGPQPPNA